MFWCPFPRLLYVEANNFELLHPSSLRFFFLWAVNHELQTKSNSCQANKDTKRRTTSLVLKNIKKGFHFCKFFLNKQNPMLSKMWGNYYSFKIPEGREGIWDRHVHSAILKMDNQQGPIVYHKELCSMLCGSLDGKSFKENGYRCMCGWAS